MDQRELVLRRHVRGEVRIRIAVGPHHEAARLVERDVGPDLLLAVDHAARKEVAHRPRLGG